MVTAVLNKLAYHNIPKRNIELWAFIYFPFEILFNDSCCDRVMIIDEQNSSASVKKQIFFWEEIEIKITLNLIFNHFVDLLQIEY